MIEVALPSEDDLAETFLTALQADENDEAVYGWMAEERAGKIEGELSRGYCPKQESTLD